MSSATERLSKKFIGAVEDEWPVYSDRAQDYTLGPPIGYGASSTVYAATYHRKNPPQDLPCAVKVLDLDKLPPKSLGLLQRETQLMSLSKHPNVLRVRGTWMDGHKLYIAMRLMNAGSAADVMRYGWPGGMEEEVIRCILKQGLEGLNYLHINGFIHRDVKAANLLIDDDGTVLVGDLGVAASLSDEDDFLLTHGKDSAHKRTINFEPGLVVSRHNGAASAGHERRQLGKRRSFVGTPCWMAPEVINGKRYDSSADIWSFGITAIELASGRAPRSRESPNQVLLHTVQDPPPRLDRNGGQYQYSKAFEEIVAMCLVKDPSKRPTAAQLLQTPFFKAAKKKGYLVGTILRGLPPISQRQERRRQASVTTRRSIDSWDFSTTHPSSPTTSVYKRPVSVRTASSDGYDVDDEAHNPVVQRGRVREPLGHIRAHSRNASFVASEHEVDPIIEERSDPSNPPSPLAFPTSNRGQDPFIPSPTLVDPDQRRHPRTSSPTPLDLPPPTQALQVPARPPLSSSPSSSSSITTKSHASSVRSTSGSGSGSPSFGPITPSSSASHHPSPIVASSPSIWQKLKGGAGSISARPSEDFPVKEVVKENEQDRKSDSDKEKEKKEKKGFVARVLAKRRSSGSLGKGGAGMMKNALVRTTSRTYNAVANGFSKP